MQYKSSLFYRVFKANYFPNSSVMEATNPSSSSYAWKSVLRGREVKREGQSGGLEMGNLQLFGGSVGFLTSMPLKFFLRVWQTWPRLRLAPSLIKRIETGRLSLLIPYCWVSKLIWLKKNPPQPHGPARSTLLALQSQWRIFGEIWI